MMSFLTLRIWQAYAFEHPQFWQRIYAPDYLYLFSQQINDDDICTKTTSSSPLNVLAVLALHPSLRLLGHLHRPL